MPLVTDEKISNISSEDFLKYAKYLNKHGNITSSECRYTRTHIGELLTGINTKNTPNYKERVAMVRLLTKISIPEDLLQERVIPALVAMLSGDRAGTVQIEVQAALHKFGYQPAPLPLQHPTFQPPILPPRSLFSQPPQQPTFPGSSFLPPELSPPPLQPTISFQEIEILRMENKELRRNIEDQKTQYTTTLQRERESKSQLDILTWQLEQVQRQKDEITREYLKLEQQVVLSQKEPEEIKVLTTRVPQELQQPVSENRSSSPIINPPPSAPPTEESCCSLTGGCGPATATLNCFTSFFGGCLNFFKSCSKNNSENTPNNLEMKSLIENN